MAQVRKNKKLVLNKFSSTKKEILGFFYIVLSVLFLLSIYSHDPNDPNFLNSGLASTVNNYIGVVGSYTSFLFFKFFGLFAYLLPIIFIFIVIKNYKNEGMNHRLTERIMNIGLLILMIISSCVLVHFAGDIQQDKILNLNSAGGTIGSLLALGLSSFFGFWGTILTNFLVVIIKS